VDGQQQSASPSDAPNIGSHGAPNEPFTSTSARDLSQSSSTKPTSGRQPTKRPRREAVRDADAAVRDAIVEDIMHESQVPKFDLRKHQATRPRVEGVDNDEAVAEAFKAQFLVHLNERNRRRHASTIVNPKPTTVSHGPKLGGSRSQRGKMRAAMREQQV